jgi:hypothetical protein
MEAGHPAYTGEAAGIDDFDPVGGGLFGDFGESVTFDSLLGVPILIHDAVLKDSTIDPTKQYVVIAGELLKKKNLVPKSEGSALGESTCQPGQRFSSSTSAARCVGTARQMIERSQRNEEGHFAVPFRVMVSKVEGANPNARQFVSAS